MNKNIEYIVTYKYDESFTIKGQTTNNKETEGIRVFKSLEQIYYFVEEIKNNTQITNIKDIKVIKKTTFFENVVLNIKKD